MKVRIAAILATAATVIAALAGVPAAYATPTVNGGPAPAVAGPSGPALAADLSQFRAGNIISDAVFFDTTTMTEAQIQAFLQSKVSSCRSGYTCLKDWYDTSRDVPSNAMCGAYSGGWSERASTIIYRVSQACGINPQVILATLQKEQGLVTHTEPSTSRFRIAMGQGCPDTAACDTRYYGFFNQVMGAAWQFKRYANPPGTSQFFNWYPVGRTTNVGYNPNAACGSSPVFIENQATANLYYYTPYQPNAAALRAGYGEGDGCSAYGNRNFFNYFTDWFGSTSAPTIASVSTSTYVLATSGSTVWGYPFWTGGRWGTPVQMLTTAAGTQRVLSAGDIDGDGTRDLLGVDAVGAVSLYRGAAAGATFGAAEPLTASWPGISTPAGDFDGNGIPDVFTIDGSGGLQLWRGTGAGQFRAPITVGNGWGMMNMLSGGVDFTRDGVPDLIARDHSGTLYLYTGNGRGGFLGGAAIGTGWSGMSAIFSPGDFGGDGNPDILARDAAGRLWYYYGTGTGRIAGGLQVGVGWSSFGTIVGAGPSVNGPRAFSAGAGDVDGDGARDVVAVGADGTLTGYRGDGRGSWRGSLPLPQSFPAGSKLITVGDLSGDGVDDLCRLNADGTLDLLEGTGAGGYRDARRIGNGWASFTAIIGGIDFDGDRRLDLIARTDQGGMLLYRGDGKGGWLSSGTSIGVGWSPMTALFAVGDFDGDRVADIMARGADGSLWLYPTTGSGSWKPSKQIGVGWGGFTALIGPGNFDGAGGTDVIARAADGRLVLYRGNGSGGWLSSAFIGHGWSGFTQIG